MFFPFVCTIVAAPWEDQIGADRMAVIPELDRLHVFFPEPLKLGRHRLITVPESLSVLLSRFWFRDLNSGSNNDQT